MGPDDYDLIGNERKIVGRIMRARITPADTPWIRRATTRKKYLDAGMRPCKQRPKPLVMTDGLPGLMLKRTDRHDEECYDVMSDGRVVGHATPAPRIAVRVSPLADWAPGRCCARRGAGPASAV